MIAQTLAADLQAGVHHFRWVAPGPLSTMRRLRWIKRIAGAIGISRMAYDVYRGRANYVGTVIFHSLAGGISGGARELLGRRWTLRHGRFDWVKSGQRRLRIMFHNATRAGMHVDVHIGRLSLVYRVKPPLAKKLRYNHTGQLTEESKQAIINHLRSEITTGARVVQNTSHSQGNAGCSWLVGEPGISGYGSGLTRQTVVDSKIEVLKVGDGTGSTTEIYAPDLDKHFNLYIHRLYPGEGRKNPILVFGQTRPKTPVLEDRLHLLFDQDPARFRRLTDWKTVSKKEDGASCYIVTTSKGTKIWSPRVSKETGRRIEYSGKLPEFFNKKLDTTMVGMGELLFRDRFTGRNLTAAEVGGVLNADRVRSPRIEPLLRLYRMDRVGRQDVHLLPFWENRRLQWKLSAVLGDLARPVHLIGSLWIARLMGWEGAVGVPRGASVNEAHKYKPRGDSFDWRLESVALGTGPSGKCSGVVWFRSLDSGNRYKLGPGQLGSERFCQSIRSDPGSYLGRTYKVAGFGGYEARAGKLLEEHLDK